MAVFIHHYAAKERNPHNLTRSVFWVTPSCAIRTDLYTCFYIHRVICLSWEAPVIKIQENEIFHYCCETGARAVF